jgi:2,3-bisphosphoglycerate-dependent phosphoglycerate mutase
MSYLFISRHGKSEYNDKGIWTGWENPHITREGADAAFAAGEALKSERIDMAFVSPLIRNKETLAQIQKGMGTEFPVTENAAINERNYGVLTGKNKWQIKAEVGEEEFNSIRRSWDHKIEGGETLKDVYNRAVPYFESVIKPNLLSGKNILIVSSGNLLRALVKYWENVPEDAIGDVEIGMSQVIRYEFDPSGKIIEKKIVFAGTIDKEKK